MSINKLQDIEEQIKKLQENKKQLLEKHERKIGKAIIKHWGEYSNHPKIFDVIEQLGPEIERRINNAASISNSSEDSLGDSTNVNE